VSRRDVSRAAERSVSGSAGVTAAHAFSFGSAYDPGNVAFGPLVALNEERLDAGCGYDDHRHSGLDIVSWVVSGQLVHRDSASGTVLLPAGALGVLRSGDGVVHAEHAEPGGPVHLLQSWVLSPEAGPPSYAWRALPAQPGSGLRRVAAGPVEPARLAPSDRAGRGTLALSVPGAELLVGRLGAGERARLPPARRLLVHVAAGGVESPEPLGPGDSMRVVAPVDTVTVLAGPAGAELMVWALPD
jgi:quercetin 2,3-dioxygenase